MAARPVFLVRSYPRASTHTPPWRIGPEASTRQVACKVTRARTHPRPRGSVVVAPVIVVTMIIAMMAAIPVLVVVVPVILVLRPISEFVFGRPDEVHRPVAGVVLVAVLPPVP